MVPEVVLADEIRIALRANKGAEKGLQKWQATADYLSEKIPEHTFVMVPFENNSALNQAISLGEYHFALTNPASAVEHKIRYGAQPLATLVNKRQGNGYSKFGSVIFTRSDRSDINKLEDLKGKVFLAVDELGFGGWRVAWMELLNNEINPYSDFKTLNFAGGKQQRVVYHVQSGKADAGSVRTDMLERMAAAGKINLIDFKVIGQKKTKNFPFMRSTALYPEWLFLATKEMDDSLKTRVVAALFSIKRDMPAAMKGKYVSWISPLDYTSVDKLLRELKVGPYHIATMDSFKRLISQYRNLILIVSAIIILLTFAFIYMLRQNRRIVAAQKQLLEEERKRETLELQLVHSQKIESLGQLSGGIAHDFNNILGSMLGFSELALYSDTVQKDSKLMQYLNQVLASGESAKLLINQMLAFSRAKGKVTDAEVIPVSKIIKEASNLLRPLIPQSINISVQDNNQDLFIKTNKVLMEQIIMNLCLNAKDSFVDNQGTISISNDIIIIDKAVCNSCHLNVSGVYVVIQVDDTGCGMNKETRERLFEPFYSTKEVGKGTGMGLAIVHGIVHNHNGHILVDSAEGKGTTVKILIPQEDDIDDVAKIDKKPINTIESAPVTGKHLLVVDDKIYITNYLSALLQQRGYKVTVKNNSKDALSYFKKHHEEIDAVLTDQTMPDLSGLDMAVQMMKISENMPVILCTGYSESVNEEIALNKNIKVFLTKPVKMHEFMNVVNSLFD